MRIFKTLAVMLILMLAACTMPVPDPPPAISHTALPTAPPLPTPEPGPAPAALPPPEQINLDAATQSLIARAKRAVLLIPFSHWDTCPAATRRRRR